MSSSSGQNLELAVNLELGKALVTMHPRWTEEAIYEEQLGLIADSPSKRVDILVNHPTGIPVAIETEFSPARTVEKDARSRLGKVITPNSNVIEQTIALRLPEELKTVKQNELYSSVLKSQYEYCLISTVGDKLFPEHVRWPQKGWIKGDIKELATFIEYTSLSENRVAESMTILEKGIDSTAKILLNTQEEAYALKKIAQCLRQDPNEQTMRMAMAIVSNALLFHVLISKNDNVKSLSELRVGGLYLREKISIEWEKIRDNINYWPIFDIALQVLQPIGGKSFAKIMEVLVDVVSQLEILGTTSQHDLSGRMFQRLISDRKFLATYYTLPSSATLLAELAVSRLSVDWSDENALTSLKIGDFACGTGALLNASYGAMLTRYRRSTNGSDDAKLHADMIENVLVGTDIMPAATHLTTSILSSAHPNQTFKNTQIITLKYGELAVNTGKDVFIGALELIEQEGTFPEFRIRQEHLQGESENVNKPVNLPHETFDIVIMNPPFTRPTGHEGKKVGTAVPSFAGIGTTEYQQRLMSKKLGRIKRENKAGNGLAGLASNFIDLADAKVKKGGVVALVIPSTFASGDSWTAARKLLERRYEDIVVISIGGANSDELAFSADTGMAEVLVVATRKVQESSNKSPITFVNLLKRPSSLLEAYNVAKVICKQCKSNGTLGHSLYLDEEKNNLIGHCVYTNSGFYDKMGLPGVIRVLDINVSQFALRLSQGNLQISSINDEFKVPIVKLDELGTRGAYHQDINGPTNGMFDVTDTVPGMVPNFPVLWAHDVKSGRENKMVVSPDHQAEPRRGKDDLAKLFWKKYSSRLCFNRDFRLNSQSLGACLTPKPVLGGHAWPGFSCHNSDHEKPLVLWMNCTLGLLSHWFIGTRQQPGRSRLSIVLLPSLVVLNVNKFTSQQFETAEGIFDEFASVELLPANEAWRDDGRKALDRAILVDLLEQPKEVLESLEMLRIRWCSEPSVYGGKNTKPNEFFKPA